MMWVVDRLNGNAPIAQEMRTYFERLLNFPIEKAQYILITGHRRENFGSGFFEICAALKDLATKWPALQFVYPVHLNPNVLTPVTNMLQGISNIHLIEPLGYEKFIYLMRHSYLVLTDSGGIQEEAPSLGKPVLVMRDSTERPEAVIANTVRLVGANREMIFSGVELLLNDHVEYKKMSLAHNPYGDGTASKKIVKALLER
jgi:UDP-N-acetylglucosamine 2-epimerase (non-hydrolysing)